MTITPGLCSITFRTLSTDDVIDVAGRAGVGGIEWGADAHAPPGACRSITALGARTRDAGLAVVSYGSYLGMGPTGDDLDAVLDTAEALGAPMVRVWTELGVTPHSPVTERRRVTERTAVLAERIVARGLLPTLEFHPGTLTETAASANELLDAIGSTALRTHWQPDPSLGPQPALAELSAVTARLAHLHVFAWGAGGIDDRRPLADGAELWTRALELTDRDGAGVPGGRYALCEYVRDDDPDQFVADVRALRSWIDDIDHGRQ